MIIAIGVPCFETVHASFAMCLSMVTVHTAKAGHQVVLIQSNSSIVANARSQCIDNAREAKAEYIQFLDSDMIFPADTITRLLAHDKDIAGAAYMRKSPPHEIMCRPLNGPVEVESGIIECEMIPTGAMLIAMNVFDCIKKPWFKMLTDFEGERVIGEDEFFCREARAAGHEVWCDIDLSYEVGHISQTMLQIARSPVIGHA